MSKNLTLKYHTIWLQKLNRFPVSRSFMLHSNGNKNFIISQQQLIIQYLDRWHKACLLKCHHDLCLYDF